MGRWGAQLVGASSLLVLIGCGSQGDEGVGGVDTSGFHGLWAAQHSTGTDTCFGDFDSSAIQLTVRIRPGKTTALEYVALDQQNLTRETCVQNFDVAASEATMTEEHSCFYGVQEVRYTDDHLTVSGDSLEETGSSETTGSEGVCKSTFHVSFTRL